MRIQDLHELPKLRDSMSYLYLERGKIDQAKKAIEFFDKNGQTLIPVANLSLLLLGPGTSITHEAIKTLTVYAKWFGWLPHSVGLKSSISKWLRPFLIVRKDFNPGEIRPNELEYRRPIPRTCAFEHQRSSQEH